jgi:serine/threonine protein kinase
MSLRKGEVVIGLRGRYKIEKTIAYGGLGRVWLATAQDGSKVAIKEPLTGTPQDQVNFEKLRIEAVVLERLTGPKPMILDENRDQTRAYSIDPSVRIHIVHFLDVNRSRDPDALVLQFVDGKSMDEQFHSNPPSDFGVINEYGTAILNIVRALHEHNILHRDICPHNLMTTPDPDTDPVLIDFGTAKEGFNLLSASAASQIIHSGYSAPELALGGANPSSDLYSVAATILFLYTGTNPQYLMNSKFELDDRKAELRKIPPEKLEVIRKAMSYLPAFRYQTSEDMLKAFAGVKSIGQIRPYIVASGRKYEVSHDLVIGRQHAACPTPLCRKQGFSCYPDVSINDPESYISKHHAKVRVDTNRECYIEDLRSTCGTAIKHQAHPFWEVLQPRREYKLQDGDVIALAYTPLKGPYMTISYNSG